MSTNWIEMGKKIRICHDFSRSTLFQSSLLTLSANELDILTMIFFKKNQLTPSDATRTLNVKKESVSRTIKNLLAKKLIIKEKNPLDERSHFLSITELGLAELDCNYNLLMQPYYFLSEEMGADFDVLMGHLAAANKLLEEFSFKKVER